MFENNMLKQKNQNINICKKLSFARKKFGYKPRMYAKSSGSFQIGVEFTRVLNMFV
jgi:hypothetical protein